MEENVEDLMDADSSSSSDDSVDLESTQCHLVKGQYGIGSVLLQKMGYTDGNGLGISGQGILEPIELKRRAKNSGLGSIPAIDEPSIDTGDEARTRKEKIKTQLDKMHQLLHVLSTQSPYEIDISRLYDEFGKRSSTWELDRLWEILEICGSLQLKETLVSEYQSSKIRTILTVLHFGLPSSKYRALLQSTWLRTLRTAREETVLPSAIHELATNSLLDPIRKESLEFLAQSYSHNILADRVSFQQCAQLLPELPEVLLSCATDLNPDEEITLCNVLSQNQVSAWFTAKIKGVHDPDFSLKLLAQWKDFLLTKNIYGKILNDLIYPNWFTHLLSLHDGLNPEWWSDWEIKLPQSADRDLWLLKGLNAVNELYDTGRVSSAEESCCTSQPKSEATIKLIDVLLSYCERLGYKITQTQTNKGDLIGKQGFRHQWKIEDEVFYLRQGDAFSPLSIYDIANYVN